MKENVPAPSYSFFVDKLLGTIRDEIASCMEKAYNKATQALVTERGWNVAKDGTVTFETEDKDLFRLKF